MVKDHSDSERGNLLPNMGYSFQLAARVLLYAPSHRQDSTFHTDISVLNAEMKFGAVGIEV